MGKLYFYYGTMGAGKTALAINKAYEFKARGMETYVYTPKEVNQDQLDSRCGSNIKVSNVELCYVKDNSILIIDEAQFLSVEEVKQIRLLCTYKGCMAFCFGLLTTFQKELFEGSKAIISNADTIREVQCMCEECSKKAIRNYRKTNENLLKVLEKSKYMALCDECYERESWNCKSDVDHGD